MRSGTALAVVALLISLLVSPLASGAEGSEAEAKIQFEQGVDLYEEGKFEQAAIAFARAYELRPTFKLKWNIGQAQNELGHYAAALLAYLGYLEEGGDEVPPARAEKTRSEIERLRALVGKIAIDCPLEGAKVKVDNESRGLTPLVEPIFVDVGKHEVIVLSGREVLFTEVVTIAGGQEIVVTVEEPIATEFDSPDPGAAEEEPAEGPKRIWTWVSLGIGGAAGIAGGVLGGLTLAEKNDFMDDCGEGACPPDRKDDADAIKTKALVADILYGVAGVGAVAAIVLFFVEPGLHEDGGVTVAPQAMSDGVGIQLGGRF